MVVLPVEKILPQLSRGVVKITFGDLRVAAPGVFLSHTDRDHVEIVLPLAQVLSQLNPALLARRPAKVQIQVPDEVSGPFSGRGQGLIFSTNQNNKQPQPQQPAPAAPPVRSVTPTPVPTSATIPNRVNFVPMAPPTAPVAMPISAPPVIPKEPVLRMAPLQPVSAAPTPPPKLSAPAPAAAPAVSEIPDMFVPAAPAAAEPAPEEILSVPLASFAGVWPETVRSDIVRLNLMAARVELPIQTVEPLLKLGKVTLKWGVVRSWIKPAALLNMSPHDEVVLALPLEVLAPLFLERKKLAGKRVKVAIDENIPDLFFGFPQPDSLTSSDTHAVTKPTDTNLIGKEEEPTPVMEAVAAPVAAPAPSQDTNYYVWADGSDTVQLDRAETVAVRSESDFIKRSPTPNDIVTRAASLTNVAGALIALPDGLMVAGQIPPDLNGDTLAGFVPHIFNKVGQAANELRMGELNNVAFTVGNVPWKIFKVNAVLFAAFGKAGEPMPTAQLAALAAELDQKNR